LDTTRRDFWTLQSDLVTNAEAVTTWALAVLAALLGHRVVSTPKDVEIFDEFSGYMGPAEIIEARARGYRYRLGPKATGLLVEDVEEYWASSYGHPNQFDDSRGLSREIRHRNWPDGLRIWAHASDHEIKLAWPQVDDLDRRAKAALAELVDRLGAEPTFATDS
jgi:hypothetical protein